MTKVIISGPRGRMGQALVRLASAEAQFEVIGTLDSVRGACGSVPGQPPVPGWTDLREVPASKGAVLIEFTNPEATLAHISAAVEMQTNAVVGTTGFSQEQRAELEAAAERIALMVAPNTSVGINVLIGVVEQLSKALSGYDIELVEMHHRLKKDAPSGTAVALAEAAARGRNWSLDDVAKHGREGLTGERPQEQIGIHALRGGDVVGEHTMTFAGSGERIEVTHRAHSRDTFAAGALVAAKWLAGREPGIYTMRDVLAL